jgi:release factor glutamine methyltransferase
LPQAQVTSIDKSAEAQAVAQKNAEKHGVQDRVRFLQGDLFAPLDKEECFDFVLSNPPYIVTEEIARLPGGVRDYEPHLALDGGANGFAIFDRLVDQARDYLQVGGYLLVEIGSAQEAHARQRLGAMKEYELAPTIHDYSGHPRVLKARLK